jgi:ABC-type lipoprotein export system ATPase subunit
MDEDGNSKILELLSKYSSNAIIISHNSQMNEMISDSIEFYDEAGFSYMKQGER